MKLNVSYSLKDELELLSFRFKNICNEPNSFQEHINYKIKRENLFNNISLILSNIILDLKIIGRSKTTFNKIIEEYNDSNRTHLLFDDFEKQLWIRIINDEIKIPDIISHLLWQFSNDSKQGKITEVPEDKKDLIYCLQIFYEKYYSNPQLTISKSDLESVLTKFNNVNIEFLEENKILKFDENSNSYEWIGHEYSRHLKNEISSTLWLLVSSKEPTETELKTYVKYLDQLEIWPDNLDLFLSDQNTQKICELSFSLLNKEIDLNNSDDEFKKIWYDSRLFTYATIYSTVPAVKLSATSPNELIEEIEYHSWRFQDIFTHQKTRGIYGLLIRFIIHYDDKHNRYNKVLTLLSGINKPFIVWSIFNQIYQYFQDVIPYLITDSELIPIAFKLLDKIEINHVFLHYRRTNEAKFLEKLKFINRFMV